MIANVIVCTCVCVYIYQVKNLKIRERECERQVHVVFMLLEKGEENQEDTLSLCPPRPPP